MNDWDKCIDGVTDKESLLHFMKMLINDYRENSQEWEHDSIDEYLDAMTAWVNSLPPHFLAAFIPATIPCPAASSYPVVPLT